jgi:hypothetical protein
MARTLAKVSALFLNRQSARPNCHEWRGAEPHGSGHRDEAALDDGAPQDSAVDSGPDISNGAPADSERRQTFLANIPPKHQHLILWHFPGNSRFMSFDKIRTI